MNRLALIAVMLCCLPGCEFMQDMKAAGAKAAEKAFDRECVKHGWKSNDGIVLMERQKRLIHSTVRFQDRQGNWHMFLYKNGRPIGERDAGEVVDDDGAPYGAMDDMEEPQDEPDDPSKC